jgi:hypothetical protein
MSTSASTAISSGSTLTKLTRSFRASRNLPLPNFRKKRARCSRSPKSSVCPNKPRALILTAPRPMNRGNRSPRSLECRSSSMHQKSSEDRGRHGCVLWILFQIIGTLEQKAGMSSVSSAAHLGGAAVGVLAWLVWRKPKDESRQLE